MLRVMGENMSAEPVDLGQLDEQTGGDSALAREVLKLFVLHAPEDLAQLSAVMGYERRVLAHRLVGSARGVGASEVARLAASVEAGVDGDVPALGAAVEEAVKFIEAHLAG
jgi:HPt (histidine-containing phosphotransfer) domain-containing protein